MWWLLEMYCSGSLVGLQTTEAGVPGSNPASLTVENSEDRQSHCKVSGQRGRPPLRPKKILKKLFTFHTLKIWKFLDRNVSSHADVEMIVKNVFNSQNDAALVTTVRMMWHWSLQSGWCGTGHYCVMDNVLGTPTWLLLLQSKRCCDYASNHSKVLNVVLCDNTT